MPMMYTTMQTDQAIAAVFMLALLTMVPAGIWYKFYLKIGFMRGLLWGLGTMAAVWAKLAVGHRAVVMESPLMSGRFVHVNGPAQMLAEWSCFIAAIFALGIVAKVYRAWILNVATEEQRRPGKEGIRAWLRPMDVLSVIGVGVGVYLGLGWSLWMGVLALAVLLAYPVVNMVMAAGPRDEEKAEQELAEERLRVLAMVETGKITGEDGAELIRALGQSRAAVQASGVKLTANWRLMLLGAGLVVVGFCLPWFSITVGQEEYKVVEKLAQSAPLPPNYQMPPLTVVSTRAGEISYGLGWIILAAALAVAVIPMVWPSRGREREGQRSVSLVGLLVGTVLLMYLLANGFRDADVGVVLVTVGYAVMWVGAVREYVRPARGRVLSAGAVG